MTKESLEISVNALLAPAQPITANGMHKPSMQHVINELYNANSRGAVLSLVTQQSAFVAGDELLTVRSGATVRIPFTALAFSFVDGETPAGAIDGVNTAFTLANTPIAGSVHLYMPFRLKDGVDYNISGPNITMIAIPQIGDTLLADYRK